MATLAKLRATADQSVRIHHGPLAHVRADVDIHGRHTDHAFCHIAAVADAGAAGHEAHAVLRADPPDRVGGFIKEWLPLGIDRHVDNLPHPKAEQDPFLDPAIDAPAGAFRRTRFGSADASFVESGFELSE